MEIILKMNVIKETSTSDVAGKAATIIDESTPYLGVNAVTPFYFQGIKYRSLGQFIECQKALIMEAYETFHAIHRASSTQRITSITKNMAMDYEKWYRVAEDKMKDALLAKFSQNYGALSALLSTGDTVIIYSDAEDGFWGTGLAKSNPAGIDENIWPGRNRLGVLMARVRAILASSNQ